MELHSKALSRTFSLVERRHLGVLAYRLDAHDPLARGHYRRVAYNALLLGRAYALAERSLETLYWGGRLHDLGKLALPCRTLLKADALSAAERSAMRCHPTHGWNLLLERAPTLLGLAKVILHHHERWDAQGYPNGLSEEAIPLLSRIVSVADVFEALTGERPYRRALPPAQALAYVQDEAGRHFDPVLAALFAKLYNQGDVWVATPVLGGSAGPLGPDATC